MCRAVGEGERGGGWGFGGGMRWGGGADAGVQAVVREASATASDVVLGLGISPVSETAQVVDCCIRERERERERGLFVGTP